MKQMKWVALALLLSLHGIHGMEKKGIIERFSEYILWHIALKTKSSDLVKTLIERQMAIATPLLANVNHKDEKSLIEYKKNIEFLLQSGMKFDDGLRVLVQPSIENQADFEAKMKALYKATEMFINPHKLEIKTLLLCCLRNKIPAPISNEIIYMIARKNLKEMMPVFNQIYHPEKMGSL